MSWGERVSSTGGSLCCEYLCLSGLRSLCRKKNTGLSVIILEEKNTQPTLMEVNALILTVFLDITQRIRQEVVKNESGKKRFAILAVIAFVLSLLVAVAALVCTNIELKNQMNSIN